jgi:hypothetical protein
MKALHASIGFLSCKMAAGYTRVDQRSRKKMRFFVDALEIKCLCLWQRPNWSHGEHFWDQEEVLMISGALMQEESGKHAVNIRSHAATRARWRAAWSSGPYGLCPCLGAGRRTAVYFPSCTGLLHYVQRLGRVWVDHRSRL